MTTTGIIIIVVLTAALFLLTAYLIFHLFRVGYGILHYIFVEKKPTREFQHPQFGTLHGNGQIWTGCIRRNGREIPFLVTGSETAPNLGLLDMIPAIVSRFDEFEHTALEFLYDQEPTIKNVMLKFYMLELTEKNQRNDFVIEFDDGNGSWRVEFEKGQPKEIGYDD